MAPIPVLSCLPAVGEAVHKLFSSLQTPTRTVESSPSDLRVRQAPATTVTVTSDPNNNSGNVVLSPGAIAGIVIGSIVGFLLLLWVVRSCMNLGAPPQERENWYHDVEPRRSHDSHRRHHHHHHGSRRGSHSQSYPEVGVMRESTPVVIRDERRKSRDYHSRSPRRPEVAYVQDSRGRKGRSGRYYESG